MILLASLYTRSVDLKLLARLLSELYSRTITYHRTV